MDFDDFDPLQEALELADSGDKEAESYLLERAINELDAGQITDVRLRRWLADYLSSRIPKPRGAPPQTDRNFNLAYFVEWNMAEGMTEDEAHNKVAEKKNIGVEVVRKQHKIHRQPAKAHVKARRT